MNSTTLIPLSGCIFLCLFQESEQGLLFNGQYMYLVADLKNLRKQAVLSNTISSGFNASKMLELYHSYRDFIKSNPRILVWGAGAKGATFVNLTDPNKEDHVE